MNTPAVNAKAKAAIAVLADDATAALDAMRNARTGPTRWVLVACAPRMTYRVSKWVSHTARESWRQKWADKLCAPLADWVRTQADICELQVARASVTQVAADLSAAGWTVLDARRPREPLTPAVPAHPTMLVTATPLPPCG